MKDVSAAISKGSWKGWGPPQLTIPPELLDVADAFRELQEAHHLADYEDAKIWISSTKWTLL